MCVCRFTLFLSSLCMLLLIPSLVPTFYLFYPGTPYCLLSPSSPSLSPCTVYFACVVRFFGMCGACSCTYMCVRMLKHMCLHLPCLYVGVRATYVLVVCARVCGIRQSADTLPSSHLLHPAFLLSHWQYSIKNLLVGPSSTRP